MPCLANRRRGKPPGRALLAPLRADPARAAILTDVDGTLAPIAARAEQAAVPAAARAALARLSERYGLVGCVSGRQAEEARRLVGVDELAYAGNHGLELLLPGDDVAAARPLRCADSERGGAEFLAETRRRGARGSGPADRGQGPDPGAALARRRRRARAPRRGRTRSPPRPAAPGSSRAGAARCWSCARSAAAARTPRSPRCSPASGSAPRSTPATTAPTSTPSAACASSREEGDAADRGLRRHRLRPRRRPSCAEESDLAVDGPEGWLAILEWLGG